MAGATLSTLGIWIVANMGPLSKGLQAASAQLHRFSTATRGVFQQLDTQVNTFNSTLQKNTAQFGIWAAAGTILFMRLVGGTLELQRELTKLGTFLKDDVTGGLGTVQKQLALYRKEIFAISLQTGQAADNLAAGLSRLIQFGLQGKDAIETLRASAEFATVSFGDVEQSTTAVVKIMDAFNVTVDRSREFFGKLFAAIDVAEAVADDFATQFVKIATTSRLVGAGLEDALGAFALLTFRLKSPAEAATALERMMMTVLKHSQKASEVAEEFAINLDSDSIATMGLVRWVRQFGDITKEAIGEVINRLPGLKALGVLLEEDSRWMKFINETAKGTADTFATKFNFVIASTPAQLDILKASLLALRDTMVENLLSALGPTIRAFTELLNLLNKIPDAVKATILALGGTAVIGTSLFFLMGLLSKVGANMLVLATYIIPSLLGLFPLLGKGMQMASTQAWRLGGTASTLTVGLRKLSNMFTVMAFAPGLTGKAMQKFTHLNKAQAAALSVHAMKVRTGMMGINQAAAALAPTLGVASAEAKKMIVTMKGGALALPPPSIFQKVWGVMVAGVMAFGNALRHPIKSLGAVGGALLRITTLIVPRFIGGLRIVMAFLGGPIAWVILGIITLLAVAFPGSLSRLGKIFVETLKLIWTLAKVVFHGIGIAFSAATKVMGIAWKGFIDAIPDGLKEFVRLIQEYVIETLDWVIYKLREAREFYEWLIGQEPKTITFAEALTKRAISVQELQARAQRGEVTPEAVLAGLKSAKQYREKLEKPEDIVKAHLPGLLGGVMPVDPLLGKSLDYFKVQIKGLGNITIKQGELNIALERYNALVDERRRKEEQANREALKKGDELLDKYRKEFSLKSDLLEKEFAEIFKLVQGDTKLRTEALQLYQLAKTKAIIADEKQRQEIMGDEENQERLRLYESLAEIKILARTDQESLLMRAAAYKAYQEKIEELDKERFKKAIAPLLEYIKLQEEAAALAGMHEEERFFAQQRISLEAKKAEKETGSTIAATIARQKGTIELEDKRLDRIMKRANEELKTGKKIARSQMEEDKARRQFIEEGQIALKQYAKELEKMDMSPEAIEQLDQYQEVLRAIVEEMDILEDRSTSVFDAIMRGFDDAKGKAVSYLERLREAVKEAAENIRSTLSDVLFDWVTGEVTRLGDAFRGFLRGIIRAMTDFIASEIVRKFIELLQDIFKWERTTRMPKIEADELHVKKMVIGEEGEKDYEGAGDILPKISKTFFDIFQKRPDISGKKKGGEKAGIGTPSTFPGMEGAESLVMMQDMFSNILGNFSGGLKDIFGDILGIFSGGLKDNFGDILSNFSGGLKDIFGGLLGGAGLGSMGGGGGDGWKGFLKLAVRAGAAYFTGGASETSGIAGILSKIIPFQEGGIVKGTSLGLLHGPEAVIPLDRMEGGGPMTLQFNVNTLDGANFQEYLRRNADILSEIVQSELLRNKNLRKTLIRMG
jgi:TP901 family phage tail tape measure protein